MNRDERRDRAAARPPRRWQADGGSRRNADGGTSGEAFTAPIDGASGGTWIAARDSGVVIALLNHHPPRRTATAANEPGKAADEPDRPQISRGLLVTRLAASAGLPDAARLRAVGLRAFAPFRLFVAGPAVRPRVFTWDGVRLTARRLDPRFGFLTSSSWNPRSVVPARQAAFRAFAREHRRPTRAQLLAFFDRSGHPRGTAWAICMSRDDACTVSRTVVEWNGTRVAMRYAPAPGR